MLRFSTIARGMAGVPKVKHTPERKQRMVQGVHFQHKHLRLQPWYYCPLCAEPKQEGAYCRREDCRKLKP